MSDPNQGLAGQSLTLTASNIIEVIRTDLDCFAGFVLPDDCTLDFPPEYVWMWSQLTANAVSEREFLKFALGLPRGHGKTQLVKLFMVWCILFSKKRYILIIGATIEKASAILSDVCTILSGENVQTVFGNFRYDVETDSKELKVFTYQGRKIVLQAAGTGTSIRGSNRGNSRPDLILFDDVQTSKCADSLTESAAFHKWFTGDAMKVKSDKGCTFIYIGNMYRDKEMEVGSGVYTCMLRMLQKMPQWISFIVGGILSDGTALWEELIPLKSLLEDYEADKALHQEEIFFAEILNDPRGAKSKHIDFSKVTVLASASEFPHQGSFIVIDPATNKDTPDQITFGYYEVMDNIPVLVEMIEAKVSGPQTVETGMNLAFKHQCSLIVVEDNAYQHSLCNWFDFVIQQRKIYGIKIAGISSTRNKNGRILSMFKSLMAGEIYLTQEVKSMVEYQANNFNPAKINNLDDILDNITLAQRVVATLSHMFVIQGTVVDNHKLPFDNQDHANYHLPNAGF